MQVTAAAPAAQALHRGPTRKQLVLICELFLPAPWCSLGLLGLPGCSGLAGLPQAPSRPGPASPAAAGSLPPPHGEAAKAQESWQTLEPRAAGGAPEKAANANQKARDGLRGGPAWPGLGTGGAEAEEPELSEAYAGKQRMAPRRTVSCSVVAHGCSWTGHSWPQSLPACSLHPSFP